MKISPTRGFFKMLLFSSYFPFQNIESRLRIPIPDNVSGALADGVILCHIANHVKPRVVATIHVPSAGVVSSNYYSLGMVATF